MIFRVVLFDLDGTLLDTLDDLADSANLRRGGLDCRNMRRGLTKLFVVRRIKNLVRRAVPENRRDRGHVGRVV